VYGGLQDNSSWVGDTAYAGGISNSRWENLCGGDGFWTLVDPTDPNAVYCESQGGYISRIDRKTMVARDIQPKARYKEKLRFNWNTPIHVSATQKATVYIGSQFLFRSKNRGNTWERVSPDLTTNDKDKQKQEQSGGVTVDNSSAEMHTTIYSISESPKNAQVIWVGTDDGNLQVTRDGGRNWSNVTKNLPGLAPCTWISYVSPSPHDAATCFVTADGHMLGDFTAHVIVTHDLGRTWKALATGDMRGYAHVVRQDTVNPELLFVGTEWGLYGSLDGGTQWAQIKAGIPCVAVRDLAIQPREGDLLVATHGRGIYVIDDLSPLRSLTRDKLAADAVFLTTRPNVLAIPRQEQRFAGSADWAGDELPEAAIITYYLKKRHLIGDLKLEVFDESGKKLATLPGGRRRGINRVEWPMRLKGPKLPPAANLVPNNFAMVGPRGASGTYTAKLTKNKDTYTTTFTLVGDPRSTHSAADRAEQVKLVHRLYDRLTDLTYTVECVQAVRDSARARARALGKDALATKLGAFADRLEAFRGTIVAAKEGGRLTGEERLREQLGDLYGKVNGYDGRPTNGQVALADVLEGELKKGEADFAAMLARDLPALNAGLTAKKLPTLEREPRESWEQRNELTGRGTGGMEWLEGLPWLYGVDGGEKE
jgi:photosystem II stability/assembly factor-like uncharacterized protein